MLDGRACSLDVEPSIVVVGNGASLFEAGHSFEKGPSSSFSIQKGRIPLLLSVRRSSQQESFSCCDPGCRRRLLR